MDTTLIEGGKAAAVPLKLFTSFSVVKNPWAGRGFVDDLKPEIHAGAPLLGDLLTKMIIDADFPYPSTASTDPTAS
ncbi:amino acid synthesis family protein, partial [Rhizobium johnstonii]